VCVGVRGFLRGGGEKRGMLGMLDTSSTRHGHTRFTFRRSSGSSQVTYEIGEATATIYRRFRGRTNMVGVMACAFFFYLRT